MYIVVIKLWFSLILNTWINHENKLLCYILSLIVQLINLLPIFSSPLFSMMFCNFIHIEESWIDVFGTVFDSSAGVCVEPNHNIFCDFPSGIDDLWRFWHPVKPLWVSNLTPKTFELHVLVFQYFDFGCTWRMLFQKRVVCSKLDIHSFIIPTFFYLFLYLILGHSKFIFVNNIEITN